MRPAVTRRRSVSGPLGKQMGSAIQADGVLDYIMKVVA